jgi:hypothetical protein
MLHPALALLFLALLAAPALGAGPSLGPGTVVQDGSPDRAVVVLLSIEVGPKDSQSVYTVRPVFRCLDPGGSGWYGPPSLGMLRSAPELEAARLLGVTNPHRIPSTCTAPALSPAVDVPRSTGLDRLMSGSLRPFGPITGLAQVSGRSAGCNCTSIGPSEST